MGLYDSYEHLLITQEGAVLTISLNNPPMNPIAGPRHRELSTIFHDVNRDDSVKVIVLTAPGDVFSAGGDINAVARRHEEKEYDSWVITMMEGCEIVSTLLACRKPIIARINGNCLGLGASIALLCDITIIVDDAYIGDPHVKIGLTAGDGGALIWPQHIGFTRAKEYVLLGENVPAKVAAKIGLVNHAVPRAELDEKVNTIAGKFARLPALSVQTTKIAMNKVLQRNFDGLMEAALGLETWAFLGKEHQDLVFAMRDRWAKKNAGGE